jgi:hypothetical protein
VAIPRAIRIHFEGEQLSFGVILFRLVLLRFNGRSAHAI